jgi:hypothetical protein
MAFFFSLPMGDINVSAESNVKIEITCLCGHIYLVTGDSSSQVTDLLNFAEKYFDLGRGKGDVEQCLVAITAENFGLAQLLVYIRSRSCFCYWVNQTTFSIACDAILF